MKVYLVGGAVRDELLGLPVHERDYLVVGATEEQMLHRGFRRLGAAFPVFLHPETGDEYALARRERKTGPGYRGFAVDAGQDVTLEQDLARRDFTVNAMVRDESGRIIDPFRGRDDLDEGVLRHITPAFVEDPVRVLRAARFTAKLGRWGFRIAHGTSALLKRMARLQELETLVPDRLREEMVKALCAEQPWRFFQTLQGCGALGRLLPELAQRLGPPHNAHGGSAQGAPLAALERACGISQEPAIRLAALLGASLADAPAGRALCARLRLDRDTARLIEWSFAWPARRRRRAVEVLDLLDSLRAQHHPERLARLALVWRAVDPESGKAAECAATRALAAVSRVQAASLATAGWKGRELGEELARRRLQAVIDTLFGAESSG